MSGARPRLGDFSTDRRVLALSAMALAIGALGAVVAWGWVWLIAVITNLAYFGRVSSRFVSPSAFCPWSTARTRRGS